MTTKKLLSQAEVIDGLGGRTTKQASALLALIENRTAHLVAQAQQVGNVALTVAATANKPRSYLAAIAQGRAALPPPTLQEIERYAVHWAMLVPENPAIRAALVYLLGQKYALTTRLTPGLSAALGLARPAVQEAYQRLYHQPISASFAPTVNWGEGLRWWWSTLAQRLEALPPFWLALFLTMPGASGLLALPIALANVGPLWGVLLILAFGIVNLLTVAALAETVVRSGTARFGLGFLGQLAQEYLGGAATTLLTVSMLVSNFLVLVIFFFAVGGTLAGATGAPAVIWMLLLFGVTLYFLAQRSLSVTVASTLLIVLVNLLIVVAIPLLALPYFQWSNLTAGLNVADLTPATWGSLVGILSTTFLSHFLVMTYGPVILPRDPGGHAWLRGSMTTIGLIMLIAILWLLVIEGVLAPDQLRSAPGTVVIPLALVVGPVINWLGALLVILSLGLATVQVALAQYYSLEEWLPARGSASWLGQWPERQRFWLTISPMFLVLALAIWLASSGIGSFAGLLGSTNALALPVLSGVIPLLLLIATRRKGDFVPGFALRALRHPLVFGLLYLIFVGSILLHGLYIWQAWPLRLFALGGGLVILAVTWRTWQQGLWQGRVVIEVRQDERVRGESGFHLAANGQPLAATVRLDDEPHQETPPQAQGAIPNFRALQRVTLALPTTAATRLKIWVHRLPIAGGSVGLPARVTLAHQGEPAPLLLTVAQDGQLYLPLPTQPCQVEITLEKGAEAAE